MVDAVSLPRRDLYDPNAECLSRNEDPEKRFVSFKHADRSDPSLLYISGLLNSRKNVLFLLLATLFFISCTFQVPRSLLPLTFVAPFLHSAPPNQYQYQLHDLSLLNWSIHNAAKSIVQPAKFPSQVHIDLLAANVIEDPYRNLNEFDQRWVSFENWTYSATLFQTWIRHLQTHGSTHDIATPFGSKDRAFVVFDGLDTFASITLCGRHVASTSNQFRQYTFDVTSILRHCYESCELSINFGSAVNISNAIAAQPGQETWPWPIQGTFEFPNRWFIRKEQSDFGWDWGPALAPAGPWLPARIVYLSAADVHINNALVDIYREGQLPLVQPDQRKDWILNVSLDVLGDVPKHARLLFSLEDDNHKVIASGPLSISRSPYGTITGFTTISRRDVQLWWPVNMGPQTLYNLRVRITGTSNSATVSKRVGFRTIVQNAHPVADADRAKGIARGNHWHFEINGRPFYAKGSNFIPPDALWARVTPERIKKLFDAVVVGNQNMLRVWSSGAYSPNYMFDLADEMGILLWSEFQFGDALYPVDDDFIDNVKEEVYYQVRRCNHHPSLAYWAGGNELENVELGSLRAINPDHFDKYLKEYEYLFLDTIVPILFENSRSISYSPSSTSNGWLKLDFNASQPITERYDNKTPGSIYGVTDYYNYDSSQAFNLSTYPIGRFSNEFGFHSMPSIHSWRQAVKEEYLQLNSSVVVLRNHHYPAGSPDTNNFANATKGINEMTTAVQRWLPTPDKSNPAMNFSSWCHASQLFQAMFYKSQIEFYRRGSGRPQRTLGCLYWQLEDIWQAPTWAGIEYDGRWKVMHYTTMEAYRNVVVAPFFDAESRVLEIFVTSDLWVEAQGRARFTWLNWTGHELDIDVESTADFVVGALNTTRIQRVNITKQLKDYDLNNIVLRIEIDATGMMPNSNTESTFTYTNWFHPKPLASASIADPGLQHHWDEVADELVVRATKGVSAWTWIEHPPGVIVAFEGNGFWLARGEERRIKTLRVWDDTTGGRWKENLTVKSVWDLTQP